MKYWVYKDSQILGPLAKEDLGLAGGVRPETLVCAEDAAGRMDADWRCADEVGELSSLCATAPSPAGGGSLMETDFGLMERLQFETLGLPGEADADGWLADLFSPPSSRIPAADLVRPEDPTRQELKDAQAQVKDLTAQLELLTRRLSETGAAPFQTPTLPKASSAAPPSLEPPLEHPPLTSQPVLAPLPKVDVPAPEAIKPPVQEGPALAPEESPYQWDTPSAPAGLPQIGSAPPAAQPADTQPPPAPPAKPESPAPVKGRPRRVVKVSAPQSLRKVDKSSPPSLPAASQAPGPLPPPPATAPSLKPEESPYQWGPQSTPTGGLPQAGSSPAPAPGPAAPAPFELSAPPATIVPGAFLPQMTAPPQPVLSPPPAFAPAPAVAPPPATLEAPPVPTLTPNLPTPAALPPMTMAFSGAAAMPSTAAGPAVMPMPGAGPSTQEVLAKLAKPAPAKTEPPKAPKARSKTFLIIIGVAALVVAAAAWFFLRDSKSLKTALQMDSGRAPVGAEVSEEAAGAAKAKFAPAPQTANPAPQPAPAPQTPAPQPQAAPAPQAPAPQAEEIRDERPAAIDLVKEFPLDGDRGTIGQWLQYSFAATPGAQNEEKWDAGAYEESTYAVKYTVQPAGKDAITYLFEADVARMTVKGMNEAARKLLAGGTPVRRGKPAAKAKPAKPKKRTPPRRVTAPAPVPKEVPLMPLPSDADLTPPANEESGFQSDTVQPNL